MTFRGYIRVCHYILKSHLLIHKLVITYDTPFRNFYGLQGFCRVEKKWQQAKCRVDRGVLCTRRVLSLET